MNEPFKVEQEGSEYTIYEWTDMRGEYVPLYTSSDWAEIVRIVARFRRELAAEDALVKRHSR